MVEKPNQATAEQMLELRAALGDAARATGQIDMALVMLLAPIIHPPPFFGQDLRLASIVIFSQNTIERRLDIVRRIITARLEFGLSKKIHEYEYKLATFLLKALNSIFDLAKQDVWIRNVAAHGELVSSNPPILIPSPFDFDGVARFHAKRGGRGPAPFMPDDSGLTAKEITAATARTGSVYPKFMAMAQILTPLFGGMPAETLQEKIVALGKDLKLDAPLPVRPRRKAKPPHKPA